MPECQTILYPLGGQYCRNGIKNLLFQGGQLSGMGGQFRRNRGSINSGIYMLTITIEKALSVLYHNSIVLRSFPNAMIMRVKF